jgi:hypothetical protein
MKPQILFENPHVKVEYDKATRIIYWVPVGNLPHESWTASFEEGFKFLHQHASEVQGWINDCRDLTCVKEKSIDWLARLCSDLMHVQTPPKIAFIEPLNMMGKISIKAYLYVSTKENPELKHGLFTTHVEAVKWILNI